MSDIATLTLVVVACVMAGLAFTVGILLVRRVMGQLNAERLPSPVERVVETLEDIETGPDLDPADQRGGVF